MSFVPYRFDICKNCPTVENYWRSILPLRQPFDILEIGSFEGLSTSLFLDISKSYSLSPADRQVSLTCVDSWAGGEEHAGMNFSQIERNFDSNILQAVNAFPAERRPVVRKIKSLSHPALLQLNNEAGRKYDLIYVDGSHHAADTLGDIVLSWFLLRVGGLMILDDYLWREPTGKGAIHEPKIAIDSFTTIFGQRLSILGDAPLRQLYFVKTSD